MFSVRYKLNIYLECRLILVSKVLNERYCRFLCFGREVGENCALLSCYAASSGNFLPTFRDIFKGQESQITNTRCVITQKGTVLI